MKIGSILKTVGGGLLNAAFPGSVSLINAILPADKKLADTATGQEAQQVIDTLPPDQKATVLEREIDLKIEQERGWTERYKAMQEVDKNTHSTRPTIARMMARVLCFEILAFTVWCFWHVDQMDNPVLWTVFATLTGVPAGILAKYFGDLKSEHRARAEVAGAPAAGIASIIGGLLRR